MHLEINDRTSDAQIHPTTTFHALDVDFNNTRTEIPCRLPGIAENKSRKKLLKRMLLFVTAINPEKYLLYEIYQETFKDLVCNASEDILRLFLESATDEEVLDHLGEASLRHPLNDPYYRIHMSLFSKVFERRIGMPEGLWHSTPLDFYHENLLENLRRDLRKQQLKRIKNLVPATEGHL